MKSKAAAIIIITLAALIFVLPATSHAWRGWGGPGYFAGGVVVGGALAAPWYAPPPVYVYPPPEVYYTYPPEEVYYMSQPGPTQAAPAPQAQGKGQWVQVPGQMVNNMWVPPHKVWVPDNSPNNSASQPPVGSQRGAGQGS